MPIVDVVPFLQYVDHQNAVMRWEDNYYYEMETPGYNRDTDFRYQMSIAVIREVLGDYVAEFMADWYNQYDYPNMENERTPDYEDGTPVGHVSNKRSGSKELAGGWSRMYRKFNRHQSKPKGKRMADKRPRSTALATLAVTTHHVPASDNLLANNW